MNITLPLDKMTVEEKLRVMEEIWEDLCKDEDQIPVPAWHLEVLRARERLLAEGKTELIDWEIAKKQLDEEIARGRLK